MNDNISQSSRRTFLKTAGFVAGAQVLPASAEDLPQRRLAAPEPLPLPKWMTRITRMTFATPGEVEQAAKAGAQVFHTNVVWPYFPLKRDGGGLRKDDDAKLRELRSACKKHGIRLMLGLPPFPSVETVTAHPDWRIHPDRSGTALKIVAKENNLGTRNGCNLGPWGDYLIEVCGELVRDYKVDGFSFDGNYHPSICFCPACDKAYRQEKKRDLPAKANLDDVDYREYLVWRGEKLEEHYLALQRRIKKENADAVIMTWTVNAGRYGHFLYSPRAMPVRLNRLFDGAMQEWWLDETNLGASVAPVFGAAYLRAVVGNRPCSAEPYLMSRGNPYGSDSFPIHERITRAMLALTNGSIAAESLGWPGRTESAQKVFAEVEKRSEWLTNTTPVPWAAILVSEQTRQFYAYKDIAERFLPHVFGAFRACIEEHLPISLITDDDIAFKNLQQYAVLVLPNTAALSDLQAAHISDYVRKGGALVATGETSLCDELGRPRPNFALADMFGVNYQGRPKDSAKRPDVDPNFAVALDANYWKQRTGIARLTWGEHPIFRDSKLSELVATKSVIFKGPLVRVSEPTFKTDVVARMVPEGGEAPIPAMIARPFGKGRVAYLPAAVDAALWSYAYPYQRRLFTRTLAWAASRPNLIEIKAPMCVQASVFQQEVNERKRLIVHLFNGLNTTANHGLPAADVPLREETVPIHGIQVRLKAPNNLRRWQFAPSEQEIKVAQDGDTMVLEVPVLEVQGVLVGE